ncbi:MAG: TolC family protein [Bacteroidota bacterium]
MKYHIYISLILGAMGLALPLQGQDQLSLDDAIREALQNNYGISIARYNVQQAENQAHLGAAGGLPSVNLSGGSNGGFTRNTSITLNQPDQQAGTPTTEITGGDIGTYGFNASLGIGYTLSLASYTNFDVLKTNAAQSKESLFLTIEQTASQISSAYYNLGRLADAYTLQEEALAQSRERLAYVQNQSDFGQANRVAILNAQVSVNTDSISLVQSEANLSNAKRDLNYLMGRDVETDFAVNTDVSPLQTFSLTQLEQEARAYNSSLRIADYGRKLAELNLKASRQSAYPTLSVNGSYAYQFADNGPVSVLTQQSSDGLSVSGTISFPIFNGNQIRRNIQNAEIGIASSQSSFKQAEQQVIRDLNKAYATYLNSIEVLDLSQKSLEAAQANFDRTKELFELGQASSVLFRDAQVNLVRVKYQLRDLLYTVKTSEVQLMQLSGQLVKEKE